MSWDPKGKNSKCCNNISVLLQAKEIKSHCSFPLSFSLSSPLTLPHPKTTWKNILPMCFALVLGGGEARWGSKTNHLYVFVYKDLYTHSPQLQSSLWLCRCLLWFCSFLVLSSFYVWFFWWFIFPQIRGSP